MVGIFISGDFVIFFLAGVLSGPVLTMARTLEGVGNEWVKSWWLTETNYREICNDGKSAGCRNMGVENTTTGIEQQPISPRNPKLMMLRPVEA